MPYVVLRASAPLRSALKRRIWFRLQTAPEVVERFTMIMHETARSILALLIAIPACVFLLLVSLYFGWLGRLAPDVLFSGIILGLVIVAWPKAQELPLLMQLLCWPASFGMVRMLGHLTQSEPVSPEAAGFDAATWEELELYFDFEEVEE